MRRILVAIMLVLAQGAPGGARATPAFQIVDLGNLGTATYGEASAVNAFGDVVGWSCDMNVNVCRAFRWTRAGGMEDLGAGDYATAKVVTPFRAVIGNAPQFGEGARPFVWTARTGLVRIDASLGGDMTLAQAANDWGQIVGSATLPDGGEHAFSWTPLGGIEDLGTLGGGSMARAVSNLGHVVGFSSTPNYGGIHGFFWTSRTGIVDVGTLGGSWSMAEDVNSSGTVVGGSATKSGATHAFSWTMRGGMVDLGTIGEDWSHARLVNARGQIAGQTGGGGAFLWSSETGMIDLGSLGGTATPAALSDSGQVVGMSGLPGGWYAHAFSWTREGGMVDLGTLPGGDLSFAVGVSPTGLVVGVSTTAVDGEYRPVLWKPSGCRLP